MFIECEVHAVHTAANRTWWWRLKSRNGQIVATSETYDSMGNCNRAAKKVAAKLGLKAKLLPPR